MFSCTRKRSQDLFDEKCALGKNASPGDPDERGGGFPGVVAGEVGAPRPKEVARGNRRLSTEELLRQGYSFALSRQAVFQRMITVTCGCNPFAK